MEQLKNIPVLNIDASFTKEGEGFLNKVLVFDKGKINSSMPKELWNMGYAAYELHYLDRKCFFSNITRKAEKPIYRWLANFNEKLLIQNAKLQPAGLSKAIGDMIEINSEEAFIRQHGSEVCHIHRLREYFFLMNNLSSRPLDRKSIEVAFYYPQIIFSSLEWICFWHQENCYEFDTDTILGINKLLEVCEKRLKSLKNNKVRHSANTAEKELIWLMYLEYYQDDANADAARHISRKDGITLKEKTIERFLGKRKNQLKK